MEYDILFRTSCNRNTLISDVGNNQEESLCGFQSKASPSISLPKIHEVLCAHNFRKARAESLACGLRGQIASLIAEFDGMMGIFGYAMRCFFFLYLAQFSRAHGLV